jgi:hypothetical protein
MTYYIDPGTTKGCAVARTHLGQIAGLSMRNGPEVIKAWGHAGIGPEPTLWEKPQFYPDTAKNCTPARIVALANDLIDLTDAGRAVATYLAGPHPCIAKRPREWKGQLPKPIQHARVLGRLNASEMSLLVTAYGKRDVTALPAYIRAAAIRVGKSGELTGYSAEITELLDAVAFALTIEGRL